MPPWSNPGWFAGSYKSLMEISLGRADTLAALAWLPFLCIGIVSLLWRQRAFAAILLLSLPFIVGAEGSAQIGISIGILVLAGLGMLYLLVRNQQWALNQFHRLSQRWPALQRFGGSILESFFEGLGVLTNAGLFARFLFWMAVNWAIAILQYYLIVRAFFPQAQVAWGMFILGAAAFGGAIPSLPGAVGTFDGAIAAALTLLTGDQSTSLAVALTARFYNYLNSLIIGGIGLGREGQTLSEIYRQLVNFRVREKSEESE